MAQNRKSLPREEVRQAFEKNRTTAGRRSAAVPQTTLGGGVLLFLRRPWEEEWGA